MANNDRLALSYVDKRDALAILAFDDANKLLGWTSRTGARYISDIQIEGMNVKFIGQNAKSVSFTLQELLAIVPSPREPNLPTTDLNQAIITIADWRGQPDPPIGLKYRTVENSDIHPVLKFAGMVFWGTLLSLLLTALLYLETTTNAYLFSFSFSFQPSVSMMID